MSRSRAALMREIKALQAEIDGQEKPRRARQETPEEAVRTALDGLKRAVKAACGPSYMDDEMAYMEDDVQTEEILEALPDEEVPGEDIEEDESDMSYMDEDFMAADEGVEDDISQEYLDDVLEERRDPSTIDTDESTLDAAPTGYTARLKEASGRLDKVANYLEKQGRVELAERIDKIADAIDARIQKEESSNG